MMSLHRVWYRCCSIKREENHSECIVIKGLRMWLMVFPVDMLGLRCCATHFSALTGGSFPLLLLFLKKIIIMIKFYTKIWSCSKSTLGQRKSASVFSVVIMAHVVQLFSCRPTGDHTSLINAVLIVKYSRAEQAFLSHFKEWFRALCKFPKIVKILKT